MTKVLLNYDFSRSEIQPMHPRKHPAGLQRLIAASCLMIACAGAQASVVTFQDGFHSVIARDRGGVASEQVRPPSGLDSLEVSTQGRYSQASTDLTQWTGAEQGRLALEFTHTREADTYGITYSRGYQRFSTNADTQFTLTGFYELAGLGALRLQVVLYDLIEGRFLLREQYFAGRGGRLDLGTTLDETRDQQDRGLDGALSAGGRYVLWYDAFTIARPGPGDARAYGQVLLAIGEGAMAMAEPSALGLLLAGLLAWGLLLRGGQREKLLVVRARRD